MEEIEGIDVGALLELAGADRQQALFETWLAFGAGPAGNAVFEAAASNSAARPSEHDAAAEDVRAHLDGTSKDGLSTSSLERLRRLPLAALEALDRLCWDSTTKQSLPARPLRPSAGGPDYLLYRRRFPLGEDVVHVRQPAQLARYVRSHQIIPRTIDGTAVRIRSAGTLLADQLRPAPHRPGEVLACAGSFAHGAPGRPRIDEEDGKHRLTDWVSSDGGQDPARAGEALAHLERARTEEAEFLVLPELCIPPNVRHELARELGRAPEEAGPYLTLVGGTHQQPDGRTWRNRAHFLDSEGNTVLTHDKLKLFHVPHAPFIEGAHPGAAIELLDTPIGLVAIGICRDFAEENTHNLWATLGPDWVLIAAMDGAKGKADPERDLGAAARRAETVERAGGRTVYSNQPPPIEPVDGPGPTPVRSLACGHLAEPGGRRTAGPERCREPFRVYRFERPS